MSVRAPSTLRPRDVAGVVVVVAAALAAMAVPNVLADHRPDPWQHTHTVQLPEGYKTIAQVFTAYSATSYVQDTTATTDPGAQVPECAIEVDLSGDPAPEPAEGAPVAVAGVDALFVDPRPGEPSEPYGVFWPVSHGWANVACTLDQQQTIAMAERVRVGSAPVSIPIRLTAVPSGLELTAVSLLAGPGSTGYYLTLGPAPADAEDIVVLASYDTYPRSGPAGDEDVVVGGRAAELSTLQRRLCFVDLPSACVSEEPTSPEDPGPWSTDGRERLLQVAASLVVAPDFENQSTWFVASEVLPS